MAGTRNRGRAALIRDKLHRFESLGTGPGHSYAKPAGAFRRWPGRSSVVGR